MVSQIVIPTKLVLRLMITFVFMSARDFLVEFRSTRDFKTTIPVLLENEQLRNEVFRCIGSTEYPLPEYGSWLAIHFFQKHPKLFSKEICDFMIDILLKTENHSVQRNICTILWNYKLDLSENTELLDKFFDFLINPESLPALRIHALKNIEIHYLKKYPELLNELFSVMEMLQEQTLPSMQSMIRNFNKKYQSRSQL